MKRHLVIFARAPQLGRVKRRLAGGIGLMAATRFYRAALAAEIRRLANDRRWTPWLFVTPDDALGHPIWRSAGPRPRLCPQGRGDLGQRMTLPFQLLPPGPVVLVGSDIPALRAGHVAHAFRLLGRNDFVFGPAGDGGFWLVGARRLKALPRALFAGARWSTAHALADTLAGLPSGYSMGLADTLDDVDDAEDLQRWAQATQPIRAAGRGA
jgi:rSAM/selenodomain-associated transferase 1